MTMTILNDDDLMSFGIHKGKKLIEVPDAYLLWFWNWKKEEYFYPDLFDLKEEHASLMGYIEDSLDTSEL
jgi:uncharacterized protein (DUF3820 family)